MRRRDSRTSSQSSIGTVGTTTTTTAGGVGGIQGSDRLRLVIPSCGWQNPITSDHWRLVTGAHRSHIYQVAIIDIHLLFLYGRAINSQHHASFFYPIG
jgi:hypothetical protein